MDEGGDVGENGLTGAGGVGPQVLQLVAHDREHAPSAGLGPEVFISADIEGVAGITAWTEARKGDPGCAAFRSQLDAGWRGLRRRP